jgi:hypothetical protein
LAALRFNQHHRKIQKNGGYLQNFFKIVGGAEGRFLSGMLLARIYIALDKTQRQRAAEVIQRYRHLIPENDEKG